MAQWQLGAYIGAAHTQNSDLTLRQPSMGTNLSFADVPFRGDSFQSPFYYGIRGGYFFRPHWGAEVEFTHLKVFANVNQSVLINGTLNGVQVNLHQHPDTVVQRFGISHGVNLLMANIAFRHPLIRPASGDGVGRLLLTFRFGVGVTIPHAESTIEGNADEHYQIGSPVIQLVGGAEVKLWRKLYWIGEYKYTRTREQVDVFSGTVTSLLRSHHVVTGPAIHF